MVYTYNTHEADGISSENSYLYAYKNKFTTPRADIHFSREKKKYKSSGTTKAAPVPKISRYPARISGYILRKSLAQLDNAAQQQLQRRRTWTVIIRAEKSCRRGPQQRGRLSSDVTQCMSFARCVFCARDADIFLLGVEVAGSTFRGQGPQRHFSRRVCFCVGISRGGVYVRRASMRVVLLDD